MTSPPASGPGMRLKVGQLISWRIAPVWRQMLLSLLLTCAAFPDAVLFGSAFRMNDAQWAMFNRAKSTNFYPVPKEKDWYTSGLNDPGGAAFQSEPSMEFMRHSLATWESPFWNPYSTAGSLGPEVLVDLKFSVFTLAYSILGGTSEVYNILTLFGFWMSVFCVLRLCEGPLRLHPIAALSASVLYLLNGFSTANIGSNVAQSYVFIPVCLLTSFRLMEFRTPVWAAAAAASYMGLASYTFMPTTVTAILAIVVCTTAFAYCVEWGDATKPGILLRSLGLQAMVGSVAFCGVALIYLPVIENLAVTGTLSSYQQRIFYPASFHGLLSLFSPTHFFESYRSADADALRISGNTVFHYGVIGLGLAACAWRRGDSRLRPLVITSAVLALVVAGRVFAVPGLTWLVEQIFVIGSLGEQYIWVAISVALTILAGIGTHNLLHRDFSFVPQFALAVIATMGAVLAALSYGMKASPAFCDPWTVACPIWSVAMIQVLLAVLLVALWLIRKFRGVRWVLTPFLVALMFLELVLGAKSIRFGINDIYAEPTSDVRFLQQNTGLARTMTLGQYATAMDAGSAYKLQEVSSLNPVPLPGYRKYFMEMTRNLPPESRYGDFLSLSMPQPKSSFAYYDWFMVNLLGVKYLIAPSTYTSLFEEASAKGFPQVHVSKFTTIIENPHAFPRAFLLPGASSTSAEVNVPPDFQAKDVVAVKIVSYRNASVVLQGDAGAPSMVVLTDNWHHQWKATVNGKPVDISKVQGTFRGVPVPAGKFEILMHYAPKTLPLAVVLSGLAWLFVLGVPLVTLARNWISKRAAHGEMGKAGRT